ncbi:hypothetical protein B0T24DRAFT_292989 [Lasiosphaeria ovina]|uniref:Secreted protein n=1 Tax=Lasiosphaeria ovina TaxID=92902 RepID=A0AAE0N881_9PEZI|nr:hypothetical protein B0T24DRAFT_292989 [Lasiosphaeria ovina]
MLQGSMTCQSAALLLLSCFSGPVDRSRHEGRGQTAPHWLCAPDVSRGSLETGQPYHGYHHPGRTHAGTTTGVLTTSISHHLPLCADSAVRIRPYGCGHGWAGCLTFSAAVRSIAIAVNAHRHPPKRSLPLADPGRDFGCAAGVSRDWAFGGPRIRLERRCTGQDGTGPGHGLTTCPTPRHGYLACRLAEIESLQPRDRNGLLPRLGRRGIWNQLG